MSEKAKAPPKTARRNREAPQVNPERSGVRSGNPQLDPDRARKPPRGRREDAPHSPAAERE